MNICVTCVHPVINGMHTYPICLAEIKVFNGYYHTR